MAIVIGLLAFICMVLGNLPMLIAFGRGHQHRWAILLVQLFFGLTVIGWIIALVWAVTGKRAGQKSNPVCVTLWIITFLVIGLFEGAALTAFLPKIQAARYGETRVEPVAPEQNQEATETDITASLPAPVSRAQSGPQFYPTSFSCTGTLSRDEYMICTDDKLATLDQVLFDRYQSTMKMANDVNQVTISKHMEESVRVRAETCADRPCLVQWYADEKAWYQRAVHQMQGV